MTAAIQHNTGHALTLEPGDRVLITFAGAVTPGSAVQIRDQLETRFPGVAFTLLDRVQAIALHRDGRADQ